MKEYLFNLVEDLDNLSTKAYEVYGPMVNAMCNQVVSQNELECMLDNLFGFVYDERILALFQRICQTYMYVYPESISFYAYSYMKIFVEEGITL